MNFQSERLFRIAVISPLAWKMRHQKSFRSLQLCFKVTHLWVEAMLLPVRPWVLYMRCKIMGWGYTSMSSTSILFICVNVSEFRCKSLSLHEINSPRETAVGQLPPPQVMLRERQARGGQLTRVHMLLWVLVRSGGQYDSCQQSAAIFTSDILRNSMIALHVPGNDLA